MHYITLDKYDIRPFLNEDQPPLVNVGSGDDVTISELAMLIKEVTQYQGSVIFDSTKPDGTMRKLTSVEKMKQSGWQSEVNLKQGLNLAYQAYQATIS